jgi:hypothetical protein
VRIYWPTRWTVFPNDCFCLDWRGAIIIILQRLMKILWFKQLLFFTETFVFLFAIFFLTRWCLFVWTFFFFFFLFWVFKFFILIEYFVILVIVFRDHYDALAFVLFFLVILFYLDSFLTYDICFVYFFLNFCILFFLFFLLDLFLLYWFFIFFLDFMCILTLICLLIFLYKLWIFFAWIYKILIINIPKINRLTWKYNLRMLF